MDHNPTDHFETRVVHESGGDDSKGDIVPTIHPSSTFRFESVEHGGELFRKEREGFIYSRLGNPTVQTLEKTLSSLENGACAFACSSGMAALSTLCFALLNSGDHVICSKSVYGTTATLLNLLAKKYGIEVSFVDTTNLGNVTDEIRASTRLIHVETPANPTLLVSDIAGISSIARSHSIWLSVDNTSMSPYCQQPLILGADAVVHSVTKYLNGHSDVIAGALILKSENRREEFHRALIHHGGVLDPFNAYFVLRGIKTLAVRMERQCSNAMAVAEFLASHESIHDVHYPGLPSHPQHHLAKTQMMHMGGMLSFELIGGFDRAKRFMNRLSICQIAVSLGGVETLIQHPASMTHSTLSPGQRSDAGISDGLIRLSVGIEHVHDIIADLTRALQD